MFWNLCYHIALSQGVASLAPNKSHGFWKYYSSCASQLRAGGCLGVSREKASAVTPLRKRFKVFPRAELLSCKGSVSYPEGTGGSTLPALFCRDAVEELLGNSFVNVKLDFY